MIISLDFDDLTLEELCDLEEAAGISVTAIQELEELPGKVLLAVVWISQRRTDPDFTLEQARKVKVSEIEVASVVEEGGANPTEAARPSSQPSQPSSASIPRSPLTTTGV